eukprot:12125209-Karenia_brevis.AAC.1
MLGPRQGSQRPPEWDPEWGLSGNLRPTQVSHSGPTQDPTQSHSGSPLTPRSGSHSSLNVGPTGWAH